MVLTNGICTYLRTHVDTVAKCIPVNTYTLHDIVTSYNKHFQTLIFGVRANRVSSEQQYHHLSIICHMSYIHITLYHIVPADVCLLPHSATQLNSCSGMVDWHQGHGTEQVNVIASGRPCSVSFDRVQ